MSKNKFETWDSLDKQTKFRISAGGAVFDLLAQISDNIDTSSKQTKSKVAKALGVTQKRLSDLLAMNEKVSAKELVIMARSIGLDLQLVRFNRLK